MMRRLPVILSLIALLAVMTASCRRGKRDYSRWIEIPEAGWAYGDTLRLIPADTSLTDNDTLVSRPLLLGLTHSNDYPYSNIWLEVTYQNDRLRYRDTLDIRLCDVYGRWLGSGFGSGYQREVMLSPRASIDLTAPVLVRHIMRIDTLRGIERVGIAVK